MEIVGLAVAGYMLHKNHKTRQELSSVRDSVTQQLQIDSPNRDNVHKEYFREASLQQVLAMLVDGVYCRDQKGVDFNLVIKPFLEQEYKVDERAEHYRVLHWTHVKKWTAYDDEDAKRVGLAHYLRKDHHPNPHAPGLVIALRGTKLSSRQDLIDDIKIGVQSLDSSERFKTCQRLVESLIKKFQDHHHGTPAEICITGHSLGAAIALHIAKNLASKNQRYAVHCFNPPFITLIHLLPSWLHQLLAPILNGATELSKTASRMVLGQFLGDHSDRLKTEIENFQRLVDWMPVLYVNKHDHICSQYLKYYTNKSKWSLNKTSSKAMQMSRVLGKHARYSSLVPSVTIYVSSREKCPHELKQWYTDPELRVPKKEEYQLLERQPPVSSWSKGLSFDVNGRIHDGDSQVEESVTNVATQTGSVTTLSQTEVTANYIAALERMAVLAMATGGQHPQSLQFLRQGTNQQSMNFQQYQQQSINAQQSQQPSISVQQYQQPSINVQQYQVRQGIINQECPQQYYAHQYPPQSDLQYGQQYQQAAVQIEEMSSSGTEVGKHADPGFMSMGEQDNVIYMRVGQYPQQCYPPQQCDQQTYPPLQCDQQTYPPLQCDQQIYPPLQCDQQTYPPLQCGQQIYPPLQCDQQTYPPLQCGQQGEHFQQAAPMNGSHR